MPKTNLPNLWFFFHPTAYLFSLSVRTSLIESYSIFWQTIFHLAMSAIFEFLHDLLKYHKMFKLIYLLINFGNSRICITMERATRLQSPAICVAAVRGLSVGANYSGCCRTTTQFHTNTRSRLKIEMWNKTETCARWLSGGFGGGGLDFKVLTNEERVWLVRDVNSFSLNLPTTLRLLHRLFGPECLLPTFISSGPKAHKHTQKCGRVWIIHC